VARASWRGSVALRIVLYPDPILLRRAAPVGEITSEVRRRAGEMAPYMELEGGIGLAAPQVGWGVQLLIASSDGTAASSRVFVDPEIVWRSASSEWGEEGCLSFPGIYGEVLRATAVRVRARDLEGEEFETEAEGLYARVLQHEIDHLNGILFITKMRPADRPQNNARLEELRPQYQPVVPPPARA
jgi:peptide deformylase